MMFALQLFIFLVLIVAILWSYHKQMLWIRLVPHVLWRWGKGRSFWLQWFIYSPLFVLWLLICHWLDVQGLQGVAAAMLGLAMVFGLQAMRDLEEKQKKERES